MVGDPPPNGDLSDEDIREFAYYLAREFQNQCGDLLVPFQQLFTRTRAAPLIRDEDGNHGVRKPT